MKTFEIRFITDDAVYVYTTRAYTQDSAIRKAISKLPICVLRNGFNSISVRMLVDQPSQS